MPAPNRTPVIFLLAGSVRRHVTSSHETRLSTPSSVAAAAEATALVLGDSLALGSVRMICKPKSAVDVTIEADPNATAGALVVRERTVMLLMMSSQITPWKEREREKKNKGQNPIKTSVVDPEDPAERIRKQTVKTNGWTKGRSTKQPGLSDRVDL